MHGATFLACGASRAGKAYVLHKGMADLDRGSELRQRLRHPQYVAHFET